MVNLLTFNLKKNSRWFLKLSLKFQWTITSALQGLDKLLRPHEYSCCILSVHVIGWRIMGKLRTYGFFEICDPDMESGSLLCIESTLCAAQCVRRRNFSCVHMTFELLCCICSYNFFFISLMLKHVKVQQRQGCTWRRFFWYFWQCFLHNYS